MINTDVTCCRPKLWHYLLLYAAVAVWVDFGHIHQRHHSDTLVFTLASQYALTPYFWEQDRVGLLVPALTSWCAGIASITITLFQSPTSTTTRLQKDLNRSSTLPAGFWAVTSK